MSDNKIRVSFTYDDELENNICVDYNISSDFGSGNELETLCNAFAGFLHSVGFDYVQTVEPILRN